MKNLCFYAGNISKVYNITITGMKLLIFGLGCMLVSISSAIRHEAMHEARHENMATEEVQHEKKKGGRRHEGRHENMAT